MKQVCWMNPGRALTEVYIRGPIKVYLIKVLWKCTCMCKCKKGQTAHGLAGLSFHSAVSGLLIAGSMLDTGVRT